MALFSRMDNMNRHLYWVGVNLLWWPAQVNSIYGETLLLDLYC